MIEKRWNAKYTKNASRLHKIHEKRVTPNPNGTSDKRLCCRLTMERAETSTENRTLAPLARTICRVVELEWARNHYSKNCLRVNLRHGQLQDSRRFGLPHQQWMAKRGETSFTINFTKDFAQMLNMYGNTYNNMLTKCLTSAYVKILKTFHKTCVNKCYKNSCTLHIL